MEKSNYTDCKFICGVADKGIMKSDRLEWGLIIMQHRHSSLSLDMKYIEYRVINCRHVIIRHSSLSLDMNNIEYRVINCIMFVIIKCKNINICLHNVQLQCLKAVFEYAIEHMEICLHK